MLTKLGIGCSRFGWAAAAVLVACSNNAGSSETGVASNLAPGIADCSAPTALQAQTMVDFVTGIQHAYSYAALSIPEMNAVIEAVHALDASDLNRAAEAAPRAGYRLAPLVAGGACYWVLLPPGFPGAIEQAVVVYAPAWQRNLVLEAPHAHEDHNTDAEAALVFQSVAAKALVVSGSHRCVQGVASSGCRLTAECSHRDPTTGSTPAIPPADSDPAHSIHNALNAVHLAFRTSEAIELQLHTNAHPEINGDSLVSNGTRYAIAGTVADALYTALQSPDVHILSCNDLSAPPPKNAFCGEINTQGLASNGAADTCLGRPTSNGDASQHRFVHLEQSNYRMCRAADVGANPLCLGSFDEWASRVGAAVRVAVPAFR